MSLPMLRLYNRCLCWVGMAAAGSGCSGSFLYDHGVCACESVVV